MKRTEKELEQSAGIITRRGLVLGAVQLGFVGTLGWRLRQMQIEEADQYRLLAEENRINMRLLAPSRGLIFDRNGVPLAVNSQNYRILVTREDAGDVGEVLHRLAELITLSPEDIERILREVRRNSAFVPVTVKDNLSWEDLSRVAVNAPALPGVQPDVGQSRHYPLGSDLAHVVGYVGPVSDYDLSKMETVDPLMQIPGFQIGKNGVEAKMETVLRGKAGNSQIEVNAVGRVMRELARTEGAAGKNLQLTIDAGLQNFAEARLAGESAGAVVIDCETGDIVAAVSAPSYDPNKFVRGISGPDYRELTKNKYRPLASKTVQGTYPPGSTFKVVTALAALEAGVITPTTREYCPGYLSAGGRRFHCWKRGGHGQVDLHHSLAGSCDVYYYQVAQRCGIDRISAMAQRLGMGQRFDLPLSAVAEGLTPTRAWKQQRYGSDWQVGDTLNASIGQGYVLASPLQLAVVAARVASGLNVMPRLVRTVNGVDENPPAPESLGLNPKHLQAVRDAMAAVSNSQRGTAYRSRIVAEGLQMAGKTGTSQVRNITAAERARGVFRNEDLPWERRDHALFICYAPLDRPKYAVAVIVEHGGGGSAVAAPVARDIMLRALYGKLPPLSAFPAGEREKAQARFEAMTLREFPASGDGKSRA